MGQMTGPAESAGAAVWEQPLPWLGETESEGAPEAGTVASPDSGAVSESPAPKAPPGTTASAGTDGSASGSAVKTANPSEPDAGKAAQSQSASEGESAIASEPVPESESESESRPVSEPEQGTAVASDPAEKSALASVAPAANGSGPTGSASAASPGAGDDFEGADGGPGRYLRLLVARAGTTLAARSGAESPEVQSERNVRLIGVMTAVSVLAALGLGTVAFMSAPDGDAPQPRAARVEDGPAPAAGPGDSVPLSDSGSPSSSAPAHRKDGAPQVKPHVAQGGDSRAGSPSSADAGPGPTHAASSGGGKTVDAADSTKAVSTDTNKNQTRSTPATSTHVVVAGDVIVGYGSSRCVGVSAHAGADGSALTLQGCADEAWQKWVFASDGSVRSMGMCLDIANASTDSGATIQLARCNGGWAQKFNLNSAHDLVNTRIGKCVDAKDMGTAAGTPLQLWECGGTSNQKWHLG